MSRLILLLQWFLPVLYLLSTVAYTWHFFGRNLRLEKFMRRFLRMTFLLHALEIGMRGVYYDHFPLATVAEAASVLALAMIFMYLYAESRFGVSTTGWFILSVVFLLQLFSSLWLELVSDIPSKLQMPLFVLHSATAILGYAALMVSALYSLLYLLLFGNLKQRRFGVVYTRLPSLEVLGEMNLKTLRLGFVFLTLAIVLGILWAHQQEPKPSLWDAKILIAYLTWAIYALEIFGHGWRGWSKKRLAYLSLAGFAMILFSLLAVNLYFTSFHASRYYR